jgi:hypothetical protein
MNGRIARVLLSIALIVQMVPLPVAGQDTSGAKSFKPEELDQIVAPIALYPDPLLAQIFMASTYPLEVVEAARFVKDNPNLKDDALTEALKKQTWDDSVKSLVTFPQVLAMMNDKLDWMQKLGDAFLAQQNEVMDAVQRLRAKAQAEGNLKSTKEQTVTVEPAPPPPPGAAAQPAPPPPTTAQPAPPPPVQTQQTIIKIEPATPQVVYVPTYNPTVVYGAWPYPAYPPYYYYPPGYAAATFATAALSFTAGVAVGAALWGNCNWGWGRGNVNVNVNNYNNFTRNVNTTNVANRRTEIQNNRASGQWQHDPAHRQGVQYRDQATQQRFNKGGVPNAASRESFRGRAQEGRQEIARGGAEQFRGAQGGARGPTSGGVGANRERPAGGGGGQSLGQSGGLGGRQDVGQGRGQQAGQGNAFQGAGQGGEARSQSARGQSSLGAARTSGFQGGGGARTSSFQGGGGASASGGFHGGGARAGGGGGRGRR